MKNDMQVTITEVLETRKKVNIPFQTQIHITRTILHDVYGIGKGESIENGSLVWWEDTHGSGITHEVRKATDSDFKYFELLEKIHEWEIDQ